MPAHQLSAENFGNNSDENPETLVARLARAGRIAQRALARLGDAAKAAALRAAAQALREDEAAILAANSRDLAAGEANGLSKAMLDRLKAQQALAGFRGAKPVDRDRVADVIVRVSEFASDHAAGVLEVDINPLICDGERVCAVDALIVRQA